MPNHLCFWQGTCILSSFFVVYFFQAVENAFGEVDRSCSTEEKCQKGTYQFSIYWLLKNYDMKVGNKILSIVIFIFFQKKQNQNQLIKVLHVAILMIVMVEDE